ncbi:hypothetical protein B0G93_101291 [Bacillus sp. V-88]|nr:hypothetical protein B0G93_101291 [Bacillus sp. V-88]SLJ97020.1 hypothetical protein SAMN06295884_101291 [Bacillus sp. V-88]
MVLDGEMALYKDFGVEWRDGPSVVLHYLECLSVNKELYAPITELIKKSPNPSQI